MEMGPAQWLVVVVALQRLAELWWSRRNQIRLLASGGIEVGAGHYPVVLAVHMAWLAAMFVGIPAQEAVDIPLLLVFFGLQAARIWIIASLGPYWTTRVITVPGAPLVRRGPYRWIRHPNYAVVIAEIAVLPLAFGAWGTALIFSLANGLVLGWRIHVENEALRERAQGGHGH